MQTGDWIQLVSVLVSMFALILTLSLFIVQSRKAQSDQCKADKEANEARRIQIYQTLEIESNAIFRFEADHKYILPHFKAELAQAGLFDRADLHDKDGTLVSRDEMLLIARKYYEITCNLFEVSARLRAQGFADPEVFGSWVAWYFDTVCEWGFRAAWAALRDNYTPELRAVFDETVAQLIEEWDIPHHAGASPALDIERRRREFYRRVAENFAHDREERRKEEHSKAPCPPGTQCEIIWNWLDRAAETAPKVKHPMAYD